MTDNDPWATEPQDVVAQAAPQYDYNPPAVPETTSGEVVQTIKFGTAFDAPWLVTRGPNAAVINGIVRGKDFVDLVDNTVTIARYAQGKWSGNAPAPAQQNGAPRADTTPRSQPDRAGAPNGEKKYCAHGERTYREGVNGNGKPYKGFFCPQPQGSDQCKPEWG